MSSEQPVPLKLNNGTAQNVTYTASSARSTQLGAQTYAVRLQSTTACHIRIDGSTVVALTTDTLINGGAPGETIGCSPGQYVAAIQDSAGGKLNITELTR